MDLMGALFSRVVLVVVVVLKPFGKEGITYRIFQHPCHNFATKLSHRVSVSLTLTLNGPDEQD